MIFQKTCVDLVTVNALIIEVLTDPFGYIYQGKLTPLGSHKKATNAMRFPSDNWSSISSSSRSL